MSHAESHSRPLPWKPTTGEGLVMCDDGTYRWGTEGAAGLFLITPNNTVLMQHRAIWTNRGGTWALPGGAIELHETPAEAAARETEEETGVPASAVTILRSLVTSREGVQYALRRRTLNESERRDYLPPLTDVLDTGEHQRVRDRLTDQPIRHTDGSTLIYGLGGIFYWQAEDHTVNEWTYTTVIARAEKELELAPTAESCELEWWPIGRLEELNLMPEFRASLKEIRRALS